jgi:hypothetical protein
MEQCPKCQNPLIKCSLEGVYVCVNEICNFRLSEFALRYPHTQKTVPLHTYEYIEHAVKAARQVC